MSNWNDRDIRAAQAEGLVYSTRNLPHMKKKRTERKQNLLSDVDEFIRSGGVIKHVPAESIKHKNVITVANKIDQLIAARRLTGE